MATARKQASQTKTGLGTCLLPLLAACSLWPRCSQSTEHSTSSAVHQDPATMQPAALPLAVTTAKQHTPIIGTDPYRSYKPDGHKLLTPAGSGANAHSKRKIKNNTIRRM